MQHDGPDGIELLAWRPEDGEPGPASVARRLVSERVQPGAWSNRPGDRYGAHAHGYTKVLMCAAGSITFLVGEERAALELGPGDGFILPAGTEHAAIVGPAGCTCLEGQRG